MSFDRFSSWTSEKGTSYFTETLIRVVVSSYTKATKTMEKTICSIGGVSEVDEENSMRIFYQKKKKID